MLYILLGKTTYALPMVGMQKKYNMREAHLRELTEGARQRVRQHRARRSP
jgi:hypothetical protein